MLFVIQGLGFPLVFKGNNISPFKQCLFFRCMTKWLPISADHPRVSHLLDREWVQAQLLHCTLVFISNQANRYSSQPHLL